MPLDAGAAEAYRLATTRGGATMDEIVANRIASKLTLIHEELQRIQSTLDQLRVALGNRR